MSVEINQRIGKYRILSKLGEGGMGTVYLGEHEGLQTNAAIKLMRKELSNDSIFQKRFINEARVTAKLKHPNIIQIYDIDKEHLNSGDLYYIIMEFVSQDSVKGRTLQDMIDERGKDKPIVFNQEQSQEMFFKMCYQLCSALAYAHSKDVLHCDIKPANILIDDAGNTKLSDFGIAKVIGTKKLSESSWGAMKTGNESSNVQVKSIEGTFLYMSPEVQEGGEWTKAGDIYSLGMVIYHLLTGKRATGRWKNACEIVKELPKWFGDLLDKCLSSEPDERYADGKELLVAYEVNVSATEIKTPVTKIIQPDNEIKGIPVPEYASEEDLYQKAFSMMNSAITEDDFKAATQEFISISGYKDSDDLESKCKNNAFVIVEMKKADEAEKKKSEAEKLRIQAERERASQAENDRIKKEQVTEVDKDSINGPTEKQVKMKTSPIKLIIAIATLMLFGALIIWFFPTPPHDIPVVIDPNAPIITTNTPPAGRVGVAYNHTFSARGATPMTWSIYSGDLPIGLNLSRAGVISGTPTQASISIITVVVTNSVGHDRVDNMIVINPPPPQTEELIEAKDVDGKFFSDVYEIYKKQLGPILEPILIQTSGELEYYLLAYQTGEDKSTTALFEGRIVGDTWSGHRNPLISNISMERSIADRIHTNRFIYEYSHVGNIFRRLHDGYYGYNDELLYDRQLNGKWQSIERLARRGYIQIFRKQPIIGRHIQELNYSIYTYDDGRLEFRLLERKGEPDMPIIVYDGGKHAFLYRNKEITILLDYLNEKIHEPLAKADQVTVTEYKSDRKTVVREYECIVRQVNKVALPTDMIHPSDIFHQ